MVLLLKKEKDPIRKYRVLSLFVHKDELSLSVDTVSKNSFVVLLLIQSWTGVNTVIDLDEYFNNANAGRQWN